MSRLGATIGKRPIAHEGEGRDDAETSSGRAGDTYERFFVCAVLAVLSVGVFYYVLLYGRNVPFWDDWELVPGLVGAERTDLSWFWRLHNEHRHPLVNVVILAAWRWVGDLRIVMLATNLLLCGLALLFIRAAHMLRGRAAYADAFFPLVFLSWGHYENMIFTLQFFFVLPVMLACVVMVVGAIDRWRGNIRQIVVIAGSLVLLPLNGAVGVVLSGPVAIWCLVAGVSRWRAGGSVGRRDAWILGGAVAVTCALVALYFVGYAPTTVVPPSPGVAASARTTFEVLSVAVGGAGRNLWPWCGIGTTAALVATLGIVSAVVFVRPEARVRALAIGLIVGGFGLLAAIIGHGRASFGPQIGFSDRYAIFVAPILCGCYLAFSSFGRPELGRFVHVSLFAVACAFLLPNHAEGKAYGIDRAARADLLIGYAARGLSPEIVASRTVDKIYPDGPTLAERLEILRAANASVYQGVTLRTEQCDARERIDPKVIRTHDIDWVDGAGRAYGSDPYIVFSLPASRYVCAVEVTFTLEKPTANQATLQAFWMDSNANDFDANDRNETVGVSTGPTFQSITIPIYDTIDRLRLDPDAAPAKFVLHDIVLVEPVRPSAAPPP